jgi:WD40 repeat protein
MRTGSFKNFVMATGLPLLICGALVFNDPLEAQGSPTLAVAPEPRTEAPASSAVKLKERQAIAHDQAVTAVVVGADFFATGDQIGALKFWDLATGKLNETIFEGRQGDKRSPGVDLLQLNRAGTKLFLVSGAGENFTQCDVAKKDRNTPGGGVQGARAFGATPDGKMWAIAPGDKTAVSFLDNTFDANAVPFAAVARISHDNEVIQLAFAPDSRRVAAITLDGDIHLGDIAEKNPIWSVSSKDIDPALVAFSPDGLKIAVAGKKGAVRLLDAASGKILSIFAAHEKPVTAMAWRLDNRQLVTASREGSVRIWDTASGKRIAEAIGHKMAVRSLAVSGDDKWLVSGSEDKTVRIWELVK